MAEADLLRGGTGYSHAKLRKFPCLPGHEFESQAFDIDDNETVAAVRDIDLEAAQAGYFDRAVESARE